MNDNSMYALSKLLCSKFIRRDVFLTNEGHFCTIHFANSKLFKEIDFPETVEQIQMISILLLKDDVISKNS